MATVNRQEELDSRLESERDCSKPQFPQAHCLGRCCASHRIIRGAVFVPLSRLSQCGGWGANYRCEERRRCHAPSPSPHADLRLLFCGNSRTHRGCRHRSGLKKGVKNPFSVRPVMADEPAQKGDDCKNDHDPSVCRPTRPNPAPGICKIVMRFHIKPLIGGPRQ